MRSINYCISPIIMAVAASTAVAAPPSIVTKGNGPAAACASCHGVDGSGNAQAGFPVLAQLPQTYITKQIADFKSGTRSNPVMTPIAQAMSAEDTESAARYFGSLVRPKTQPATGDPAVIARGENLAVNGAWDRQVPPCFKCHAVDGLGVPPAFPPIAGQHASYTVNQLQAWKTGARTNDPQKLMQTVAENLTDDEIHSVAAYLAQLGNQEKKK
ncbi:MAG: c-type cytochrome [Burkholderiaceae bacterium]